MSIFAKKPDWEQKVTTDVGVAPPKPKVVAKGSGYGISEAIALLRGLPAEQSGDLVVRVVQATLASVDVHLRDIIEDATKRQKATHDHIAGVHAQIAELERQLEGHRREVAALEADLKETTSVKERLQQAEKTAALAAGRTARQQTPPEGSASGQTPTPQLTGKPLRDDPGRLKD
jgi:hypothetical protein